MKIAPRRRRRRKSDGKSFLLQIAWWIFLATVCALLFVWIGTALHFLSSDGDRSRSGLRDDASSGHQKQQLQQQQQQQQQPSAPDNHQPILALELAVDPHTNITIRIRILADQCPKAYEFVQWMINNQDTECKPCTIYRGEPVPSYWGSEDYPDRWDNGGRWGPPYALVQGGFVNTQIKDIEREKHNPPVKRGMVAWAGAKGIHFFMALADHPEWGTFHTVWGHVFEEDMPLLDALVKERPLKVLEHNNPVVTNFVDPMPFGMQEIEVG